MFDFANSSFTTVMVTAYFPIYFMNQIVPAGADGSTDRGAFLWGLSLSISQTIVVLTAPLMGALADFTGSKKKFLFVTYLGCSLGAFALGFVGPGDVALAMGIFIVANVLFSSGENFVSAFLPEIAPSHMMGRISGIAWGIGYFGGIGALLLSLFILKSTNDEGYSIVWMMIGAWFLLGGLPTFIFVHERHKHEEMPPGHTLLSIGFSRLKRTFGERRRFRQLFRFLMIYTIFSSGVTAVIGFAGKIAEDTMGFDATMLGVFLIVINISAAVGAFGIGWVQDKIGSRRTIMLALGGWIVALTLVIIARSGPGDEPSAAARKVFWLAGNVVGMSMGAILASSRALVGYLSPQARAAEFFGLAGFFGKLGAIIGPFVFGSMTNLFDIRAAIFSLGVFFVAGLILMRFVNEEEGHRVAIEANSP